MAVNPGLCRACGVRLVDGGSAACSGCGGRRIIAAASLFDLSIAHIDCDAFYASIEKRDNPSLADRPVIVGGGVRGIVTTACYVARTFGVRSAMPMFKALDACPGAVVIKPDFRKYTEASRQVRALMERATPLVEPVSIDEAFLDLSGTMRLHSRAPVETLLALQKEIRDTVGITVSIGLSGNKFLAKLASDLDKPDGFTVINPAQAPEILASLPVTAIWGVGTVFARRLERDGIVMIGDLQMCDRAILVNRYGDMGNRLADLAFGRDARAVTPGHEAKSVSAETTLARDTSDRAELEAVLWLLCERTAARMKAKGLAGSAATLKLKSARFETITRSRRLPAPSNLAHILFDASKSLLDKAPMHVAYRLIGVGYADIAPIGGDEQPGLFAAPDERRGREEVAIDVIRKKFGDGAIALGRVHAAKKSGPRQRKSKASDDGTN
ncbi:MAG: DNA polymerase IV [Parvularculaceae bacterium]